MIGTLFCKLKPSTDEVRGKLIHVRPRAAGLFPLLSSTLLVERLWETEKYTEICICKTRGREGGEGERGSQEEREGGVRVEEGGSEREGGGREGE